MYRGILIACSVTVSDDHAMLLAFVVTKAEGSSYRGNGNVGDVMFLTMGKMMLMYLVHHEEHGLVALFFVGKEYWQKRPLSACFC